MAHSFTTPKWTNLEKQWSGKTLPYFERVGQRLTDCIEGSTRTIIPDTTHASQDQDVDAYNHALLSFLKEEGD